METRTPNTSTASAAHAANAHAKANEFSIETLKKLLNLTEGQLETESKENTLLEGKLNEALLQNDRLDGECRATKMSNIELQSRLDDCKGRKHSLEENLIDCQCEKRDLEEALDESQSKRRKLEDDLGESRERAQMLEQELKEQKNEVRRVRKELDRCSEGMHQLTMAQCLAVRKIQARTRPGKEGPDKEDSVVATCLIRALEECEGEKHEWMDALTELVSLGIARIQQEQNGELQRANAALVQQNESMRETIESWGADSLNACPMGSPVITESEEPENESLSFLDPELSDMWEEVNDDNLVGIEDVA